jgi:hypothetical protein
MTAASSYLRKPVRTFHLQCGVTDCKIVEQSPFDLLFDFIETVRATGRDNRGRRYGPVLFGCYWIVGGGGVLPS